MYTTCIQGHVSMTQIIERSFCTETLELSVVEEHTNISHCKTEPGLHDMPKSINTREQSRAGLFTVGSRLVQNSESCNRYVLVC
jgi:hypothetical protein